MIYRLLTIVLIILAAIGVSLYSKKSLESQIVKDSQGESVLSILPAVEFKTLQGAPFNLDEIYQKDGVDLLVLHFWGTWCGPCEAELPELLAFIKRFETKPRVKFLLIATNDEVLKVSKHLKSLPIPSGASIHWLIDNDQIHRDFFGTTRVPETYVFSSDKTTLRKYTGPQDWNKPMFYQAFDEFLQISTRKL